MSRQEDNWIHSQLEPNDIIICGREKREPKALFEKWRLMENDRLKSIEGETPYQTEMRLQSEHEQRENEFLKSKGIL